MTVLLQLEVIFEEKEWKAQMCAKKRYIREVVLATLSFLNLDKNTISLCLLLTNEAKMRELNYKFMGHDKPTNVLSFPVQNLSPEHLTNYFLQEKASCLGDIAFGYQVIDSEAKAHNISFTNHFSHLLIHSVLHCLGYDHDCKRSEEIMWALEDEALKKLGITTHIRNAT
jgi:probable rRNA maturation factor